MSGISEANVGDIVCTSNTGSKLYSIVGFTEVAKNTIISIDFRALNPSTVNTYNYNMKSFQVANDGATTISDSSFPLVTTTQQFQIKEAYLETPTLAT